MIKTICAIQGLNVAIAMLIPVVWLVQTYPL